MISTKRLGTGDVCGRAPQCVRTIGSRESPHGSSVDAGLQSGTAERGRNRLMRWRRGEMSGHDLAREPGRGEQRDHRLDTMPLPVQPVQPLIGAKRLRDGPGPSNSADSPTTGPPLKRVRNNEIEIQTSETIETLEKKEKDQRELCAKLQQYRAIARERDEWKKKFEDLQIAF